MVMNTELAAKLHTLMAHDVNADRVKKLSEDITVLAKGHNNGELMMALCYQLWCLVSSVRPEGREALMTAIINLIDPDAIDD